MSYLDTLEKEASVTRTLNGARTYSTSSDACLDLFAVAGGMRGKSEKELFRLFDRAYIENPELAVKLLFYIRDIRGGLGEREVFRTLVRHLAKTRPGSARKNVSLIAEYGRYDDLLCLMRTPAQKEVVRVISSQLEEDLKALEARRRGDSEAHISLLAKWLPSVNTSSARTRGQAKILREALGLTEAGYRKMLSELRAAISVTECRLTDKKIDKINYEAVPAGAILKYRAAFERRDTERFWDYLTAVAEGEKKIHCDTLFPYEIVRLAEDIAGGLMVTAPSEKDFRDAKLGPYVEKYLRGSSEVSTENRLRMLRLIENLSLGTAAVGYRTESMHGAGSPQAQRIMIARQGNLAMKKKLAKDIAHIVED